MRGLLTIFGRGRERQGPPISITEVTPPSERERELIAGLVSKIAESGRPFRSWDGVFNWEVAFIKVRDLPADDQLTIKEKEWLEGQFRPDMERCRQESRGIRGNDFKQVIVAKYPEEYLTARAGGFEVPLLLPEKLEWGGMKRASPVVYVRETLLPGFGNNQMESPNRRLKLRLKAIISGNLSYLNDVFGFTYVGLDVIVREEGLDLRLGRRRPGVTFRVLSPLESRLLIQI